MFSTFPMLTDHFNIWILKKKKIIGLLKKKRVICFLFRIKAWTSFNECCVLRHVQLCDFVACQASLSMGFSRQEYCSG